MKHYTRAVDCLTYRLAGRSSKYYDMVSRYISRLEKKVKSLIKSQLFDLKEHNPIIGILQRSNLPVTQTTSTKGQLCGSFPITFRILSQMLSKIACVRKTVYHLLSHPCTRVRQGLANYYAFTQRR